jgi:hypothetical protein
MKEEIQNIIGWILCAALVIGMNVFSLRLVWLGVRSLMGKTLNLPPSKRKWARMRADVIEDEESDDRQVRYNYDYQEYTSKIEGFSVYGDKAMIYVRRSDPTVVKEFIPQPPMTRAAALSCIFIAAVFVFFEAVFIFA